MVCSPEQLAANRRNAQKSTGPKSSEGKAISRQNGLKHGLTGAGVVIADEDVAAVEERFAAFEADLRPANEVARFLVGRAALLSVRLDRAAREEAARITLDMLEADDVEADARADEFDRLTLLFDEHPRESIRKLRRSEEGIDWLLEAWRNARRDLLDEVFFRWRPETVLRLQGHKPGSPSRPRVRALSSAMAGAFQHLEPTDWPDLEPLERRAAARVELLAIIDASISELEEARTNLDREKIAKAREGAAPRAIFNPSKDDTLARKYEAANERAFYRVLKQVEAINAAVEESAEVAENLEEKVTCDEMASPFPAEPTKASRFEEPTEWSGAEGDQPRRAKLAVPVTRHRQGEPCASGS